jgi:multidrug resistance protein
METTSIPPKARPALALVFFIMLMDIIGILLLAPVAPFLVRRYSSEALMVSMITVLYAGGQFLAAPLMGKLGDRYGRRPVLLLSILGQALGFLIFGLGSSLWVLFLGRLIGGITGGNLSTAGAYIADVSRPEERSKNFAMIGTAWSLGLIFGPAAGGLLSRVHLAAPALVAAAISLLNVLLGLFLLPESLPREQRETRPLVPSDLNPLASILEMARKPGLGLLLAITSLFNFAFNGINSIASVFYIDKFDARTDQISLLLAMGGLTIAAVNTFLVPRWVPRLGERLAGAGSLLGLAAFNTAIFLAPRFWLVFPLYMLVSGMSSFTFPTLTTLSTERVAHREIGLLLGVTTAIASLMNILGPLAAGWTYDRVMVGSPYWLGALVLVAAGLLLLFSSPSRTPQPVSSNPA